MTFYKAFIGAFIASVLCVAILPIGVFAKENRHVMPENILEQFHQAKSAYHRAQYQSAKEQFQNLLTGDCPSLEPYIMFYYALALHQSQEIQKALQAFEKLLAKYPCWDQVHEVYYWCAQCHFEQEQFEEALEDLSRIQDKKMQNPIKNLKAYFLNRITNIDDLYQLFTKAPKDKTLKEILCKKAAYDAYINKDNSLVQHLEREYAFKIQPYSPLDNMESVRKDQYNIAILLPFFVQESDYTNIKCKTQFNADLYQGIQLARKQLQREHININLFAFDTKKDKKTTQEILQEDHLKNMDLIIGPLYPETIALVSEFCKTNHINFINPLSVNDAITKNNPFAFLFHPSLETCARKAAKLVLDDMANASIQNPSVAIFCQDNPEGMLQAHAFKKVVENSNGAEVMLVKFQNNVAIKEFFNSIKDENKEEPIALPQGCQCNIQPISTLDLEKITHIYCPSKDRFLVSHVISFPYKLHIKPKIIGHEQWISERIVDLHQLNHLPILFLAPNYIDRNDPQQREVQKQLLQSISMPPTKYHYIGYEMMLFVGRMLSKYGTYFQKDLEHENYTDTIFQRINYGRHQSNQHVRVLRFVKNRFIKL